MADQKKEESGATVTSFKNFREFSAADTFIGGKAYVLSQLIQQGLPVPEGGVFFRRPDEVDWYKVKAWWEGLGQPPLAVRSSAQGEDSKEFSYAGQQKTFLNVQSWQELKKAVEGCFASTQSDSSKAYRQHFSQAAEISMNVVLQVMVDARLAGVFFSDDPRAGHSGWLIEVVEGLGEKLVSGEVTPERIKSDTTEMPFGWRSEWTDQCVEAGKLSADFLHAPVDMEWAVGMDNRFYLLQARPITTAGSSDQQEIDREFRRIEESHTSTTVWDGHTFAEWTGAPSELTFNLWRRAFSPGGAFCRALKKLGYLAEMQPDDKPLLERVFGRAYINLERLSPLFFGPVPYRIAPEPRPHLVFDHTKLNWRMFLNTPKPLWRMLQVGWNLKTHRQETIDLCGQELQGLSSGNQWPAQPGIYREWSEEELKAAFIQGVQSFSQETLVWPFVLTILIESTLQSLQMMLKKVDGDEKAVNRLQSWLSSGLHTVNEEMAQAFIAVKEKTMSLQRFYEVYGHRGPGEMDLSHPRWAEWPGDQFQLKLEFEAGKKQSETSVDVFEEIRSFGAFRAPVIEQEWRLLAEMLKLREQWKMEIMKPYAHLRWMTLEIGVRRQLEEVVFWLKPEEMIGFETETLLKERALKRKKEMDGLRKISLPPVVDLKTINDWLRGEVKQESVIQGEGISLGVSSGTIVHVEDLASVDLNSLPKDFVLVAQATDPGWTPLFRKAKAIIVENGGVLSHCAIVAREMGIPAVTNIDHIFQRLPQGQKVWIDGTHGRISLM